MAPQTGYCWAVGWQIGRSEGRRRISVESAVVTGRVPQDLCMVVSSCHSFGFRRACGSKDAAGWLCHNTVKRAFSL